MSRCRGTAAHQGDGCGHRHVDRFRKHDQEHDQIPVTRDQ
jgi:hypothetical protein